MEKVQDFFAAIFVTKNIGYAFVKYLVGVEGDKVKRGGTKIYINEEFICEINPKSGFTPTEDTVISAGYVFDDGEQLFMGFVITRFII